MAKNSNLVDIPIVGGLVRMQLMRQLNRHKDDIEAWALAQAFEQLGLPNLADEKNVTRESFTRALNAGPLATVGIRLTNVFDKAAVRRDFEQLALATAAREFGIRAKTLTVPALKEALKDYVRERVVEQLGAGGGLLVDNAKELVELARIVKAMKKPSPENPDGVYPGPKRELKMDAGSISDRARQATYRAKHKRYWVPKGISRSAAVETESKGD